MSSCEYRYCPFLVSLFGNKVRTIFKLAKFNPLCFTKITFERFVNILNMQIIKEINMPIILIVKSNYCRHLFLLDMVGARIHFEKIFVCHYCFNYWLIRYFC